LKAQLKQVCNAKVKVMIRKMFDPKIGGGAIWMNAFVDVGSEDIKTSEFVEMSKASC
jgi:hypothetical protein